MSPNGPSNTTVVLVVEDQPLVRMTAADELEEAGFHVLEAANADVAMAVLEARSDEVQVLFTDVHNAGFHGWDGACRTGPCTLAACAPADLLRLRPTASRRDPGSRALHAEALLRAHSRTAHHGDDADPARI